MQQRLWLSIAAVSEGHQLPPGSAAGDEGPGVRGGPEDTGTGAADAGDPPPEPTHAELARTLVATTNRGVLSTVALDPPGYPFGSVATYALDERGRPVVFVSTMAEHTRNATADPRASLLVAEPVAPDSDPLAAGRATLIGDLLPVPDGERAAVRTLYLDANPASASYIDFGDFGFWRLEVRSVRYVGGYGRMSWVEPGDYRAARS
jgi:putative heme iron utilization protein